jgi:hypothetical protein
VDGNNLGALRGTDAASDYAMGQYAVALGSGTAASACRPSRKEKIPAPRATIPRGRSDIAAWGKSDNEGQIPSIKGKFDNEKYMKHRISIKR